jgi:hypothetical protein
MHPVLAFHKLLELLAYHILLHQTKCILSVIKSGSEIMTLNSNKIGWMLVSFSDPNTDGHTKATVCQGMNCIIYKTRVSICTNTREKIYLTCPCQCMAPHLCSSWHQQYQREPSVCKSQTPENHAAMPVENKQTNKATKQQSKLSNRNSQACCNYWILHYTQRYYENKQIWDYTFYKVLMAMLNDDGKDYDNDDHYGDWWINHDNTFLLPYLKM